MSEKKLPKVLLYFDDISRVYERTFLEGVTEYARTHGPWEFYGQIGNFSPALPMIDPKEADGIIVRVHDKEKIDSIATAKVPVITVPLAPLVSQKNIVMITDNDAVGKMAAEYFLDRGFKNFAFLGYNNREWSSDRKDGFAKALKAAGFDSVDVLETRCELGVHFTLEEQALIADWLKSLPKPAAVFTANDERGLHVITTGKKADIKIPKEVSVLGVDDDIVYCGFCSPQLSSISKSCKKAGYETAEALDDLMNCREVKKKEIVVQPTHIISRGSTDTVVAEDYEVRHAYNYIKNNYDKAIQVSDIAKEVLISRRSLERRYRRVMGRTIHDDIRNNRIEHICHFLIEKDISLKQIALSLGHSNVGNMSRYFKQVMGVSPRIYRRRYSIK